MVIFIVIEKGSKEKTVEKLRRRLLSLRDSLSECSMVVKFLHEASTVNTMEFHS